MTPELLNHCSRWQEFLLMLTVARCRTWLTIRELLLLPPPQKAFCRQWRIRDFSGEGANPQRGGANLLIFEFLPLIDFLFCVWHAYNNLHESYQRLSSIWGKICMVNHPNQLQLSGGSRISPRWGRQLSGGGGVRQHTILLKFPKNCKFGPPGTRPS